MDPDLVDHSKSSQSLLNVQTGLEVDQVRPDLRDMQSTESIDQIHSNHFD